MFTIDKIIPVSIALIIGKWLKQKDAKLLNTTCHFKASTYIIYQIQMTRSLYQNNQITKKFSGLPSSVPTLKWPYCNCYVFALYMGYVMLLNTLYHSS